MSLAAEVVLVVIAGVGVIINTFRLPAGRAARRAARSSATDEPPAQLAENVQIIASASLGALYTHAYLRPALTEVADARLAARGWRLASMPPEVGRGMLGPVLWDLVRPGRPVPEDRHGPGVSGAELSTMLDVLERL